MKEKIGLDLSTPDFDTKRIEVKVMGDRLYGLLDYLMENYQQGIYVRRLGALASEQNEALENAYIQIKKMKFFNATKKILMRIDLQKNSLNISQTGITFHFVDGLSESDKVNELFSYISHYVQVREQLL